MKIIVRLHTYDPFIDPIVWDPRVLGHPYFLCRLNNYLNTMQPKKGKVMYKLA
uniref:Uncharacterized protein n=1 Tax=Rhizophora mucronata TaxID=61149 RepID=A0A2P2QHS9_RHIMU